ncbi:MAG: hypothetical protein ACYDBV_15155 [Nitrospiria bacterium]
MMIGFLRTIYSFLSLIFLSGCAFLRFGDTYTPTNWQLAKDKPDQLRLIENQSNLSVKWKRNIGYFHIKASHTYEFIGTGQIVVNGQLYFISWPDFNKNPILSSVDASTGELTFQIELPSIRPCLACAIQESDGNLLIPEKGPDGLFYFIRIDPVKKTGQLLHHGIPEGTWGYWKGNLISAGDLRISSLISRAPDEQIEDWKIQIFPNPKPSFFFSWSYAPEVYDSFGRIDEDRFLLGRQSNSEINDVVWKIASIDLNNRKILWTRDLKDGVKMGITGGLRYDEEGNRINDPILRLSFDEEILVYQIARRAKNNHCIGKLTALNRDSGKIEWEKKDILDSVKSFV